MEMYQIRYFLALSQTLNFTKAAQQCNVAQPSFSRAIKKLEEGLGGELFRRERTRTHMTELGRMMLPVLQQSYDRALEAMDIAASFHRADRAPMRIALSATIEPNIVSPFFAELARTFPGLEVHIERGSAEEISRQLNDGSAEIALAGPLEGSWDRLEAWQLFKECLNVIFPEQHPFSQLEEIEIHQLKGETVLPRRYCECSSQLTELLGGHDIRMSKSHTIPTESDLIGLVSAGLGVAFAPESVLHHGAVSSVRVGCTELTRDVSVYAVAGRRRSPACNALIKLLRATDWEDRLPAR